MLGYELRYRKGSFEFRESCPSKNRAILLGAELMSHPAIYDLAVFDGNGRLVASESEIVLLSGSRCETGTRRAAAGS